MDRRASLLSALLAVPVFLLVSVATGSALAEPIPAKNVQGSMHGFLLLKTSDGKVIAVGDMVQVAHGNQIRSRLTFRFRDGSIDDDVTVFTQRRVLQLVSDHHIQKGPSFPKPLDLTIHVLTSEVTWRYIKDGKEEMKTEHIDLPNNLANGLVPLVLQDVAPHKEETTVSYLVGTPKPRIVKLSIKPDGLESFALGRASRMAKKYRIHIELGGVAGVIAPIIGKQPPDIYVWVADGDVPTVVKEEGSLYEGGPIWTMEQTAPRWAPKGN